MILSKRRRASFPRCTVLTGTAVRLEPLDTARHVGTLSRAGTTARRRCKPGNTCRGAVLERGSAPRSPPTIRGRIGSEVLRRLRAGHRRGSGQGDLPYVQPSAGIIEIGGICFTPAFQRTRFLTEAMFLMLAYAMDNLGGRRMQWRCNAKNDKDPAAGRRLGFRFESIRFNPMIVKGKN